MAVQVPYMLTCIFLSLEISHCLSTLNCMGCSELAVLILHLDHGQPVLAGSENSSIYSAPLRIVLAV